MKFLYVLPLVFSVEVFAVTLGEVGVATGIANTIQGTAQSSHKETLNQVKETINQHEEDQKNRTAMTNSILNPSSEGANVPAEAPQNNGNPLETVNVPVETPQNNGNPLEIVNIPTEAPQNSDNPLEIVNVPTEAPQNSGNPLENEFSGNRPETAPSYDLDRFSFSEEEDPLPTQQLEENLNDLTKEELDRRFSDQDIYQEVEPVDYKSSIQVFYKNRCPASSSKNCQRGAVLTNIKSVIFDYAHSRGNFAPKEKSEK